MKVLELFAGRRCIGKAFERKGHEVYSVDWCADLPDIDYCGDVMELTADYIIAEFGRPDVVWASPDCTTYSIAGIGRHRKKELDGHLSPKSEYAEYCDRVNVYTHNLIMTLSPRLWFIENPRGGMRKMQFMDGLPRYTVTYCQYGDRRMKPTDIWTNHPDPQFLPMCKNGDPCHESAPRRTTVKKMMEKGIMLEVGGTQYGISDPQTRSEIPEKLCDHIVEICEDDHVQTVQGCRPVQLSMNAAMMERTI